VTFAFALNKWNIDRKAELSERKILEEIYNGLERDSLDLAYDEYYYNLTFRALKYFNKVVDGEIIHNDSLVSFYVFLTRDVIVIQNRSGYESLKSKGLETVQSDSLRTMIINLYEVDYEISKKFNEQYQENRFTENYFHRINDAIAPHFYYDSTGNISGIQLPVKIAENERKILKSYFWKIATTKSIRLNSDRSLKQKIGRLRQAIGKNLEIR